MLLTQVHEAVQACARPEAFATIVSDMRHAAMTDGEIAIHLLIQSKYIAGNAATVASYMDIFERYRAEEDRSAFGVMNAATSLGRESRDPELRWSLEKLGGSVPALIRHRTSNPAGEVVGETVQSRTTS